MYEIINEELKIAACHLTDLTLKETESFFKNWEDDATMFVSRDGYVVLNKDNHYYPLYLGLAIKYLGADEKERKFIYDKVPSELKKTVDALERFAKRKGR